MSEVEVEVEVRACTAEDIGRLAGEVPWADMAHHTERWSWQRQGRATYLLAWQDDMVVGRGTLLRQSKYAPVRAAYGGIAEINALEARPTGRGVGTLLIAAAECEAARSGVALIGLAVEPHNRGARRLYERLGYTLCGTERVLDEWAERDETGQVTRWHREPADYLVKSLGVPR